MHRYVFLGSMASRVMGLRPSIRHGHLRSSMGNRIPDRQLPRLRNHTIHQLCLRWRSRCVWRSVDGLSSVCVHGMFDTRGNVISYVFEIVYIFICLYELVMWWWLMLFHKSCFIQWCCIICIKKNKQCTGLLKVSIDCLDCYLHGHSALHALLLRIDARGYVTFKQTLIYTLW